MLRKLGGISYCIYVIHLAVITICHAIVHSLYGTRSVILDLLSVLLAWVVTLTLAEISWSRIESPMIRRAHAHKYFPD